MQAKTIDCEKLVGEAVAREFGKRVKKGKLQLSQKLVVFASAIYALTWCAAVYSWFTANNAPDKLLEFTTALYAAALAMYSGKTAYENRAKIVHYKGGDET